MLQQWKELNDRKKKVQRVYGELKKSSPDAKDKLEKLRDQVQEVGKQISRMKQSNPVMSNRGSGNTTATPVFDGHHVYVVFGNGIVTSFSVKGERRWVKFVEGSVIGFGHASSPVLVGDKLVVHFNDMIALDTQDGDVVWRTQLRARHATAIAVRIGDIAALISPGGSVVRVRDGKVLLTERALQVSEGSPVVFENVVYVQSGKTSAFRLPNSAGDTVELELLWQQPSARGRRTPSPVYADGLLYGVTTNGILEVTDAETGDLAYRKRLDIGKNIYSSATAAGELIYLSSTQGVTIVIERGTEYAEVARNQLESFGSNPVFIGNRMYVRGYKHLYCIGE
jgi:outer membrane protein assembly factor BamB